MTKFLILTSKTESTDCWSEREKYVRDFSQRLEARSVNIQVFYSTYEDLEYTVKKGRIIIFDTFNNFDLKEVDFVYFKNWTYEAQEASIIANYLDWSGINY